MPGKMKPFCVSDAQFVIHRGLTGYGAIRAEWLHQLISLDEASATKKSFSHDDNSTEGMLLTSGQMAPWAARAALKFAQLP